MGEGGNQAGCIRGNRKVGMIINWSLVALCDLTSCSEKTRVTWTNRRG